MRRKAYDLREKCIEHKHVFAPNYLELRSRCEHKCTYNLHVKLPVLSDFNQKWNVSTNFSPPSPNIERNKNPVSYSGVVTCGHVDGQADMAN